MRVAITKGFGPTTLTKIWRQDGVVVEPSAVTYALTDPAGSVVASGSATKIGTGTSTSFTVEIAQADTAAVAELELTWTRSDTNAVSVDEVSVTGPGLFTEAEARSYSVVGGLNPLSDEATYTDEAIAEARLRIEEFLERRTWHSFTRRYARVRVAGNGRRSINVLAAELTHGGVGFRRYPRELLAASINGVALTAGELASVDVAHIAMATFERLDGSAWDRASATSSRLNVVLEYEYGRSSVLYEAREAALRLLIASIVPSDVSSRYSSFSNEDGTFRLNLPRPGTPSGIPFVDEFIAAHDASELFA